MNTNILSIDLNEDYKIKIDKTSELPNSYFKNVYQKAAKATEDILKEASDKNEDNHFKRQGEEYNNIIAFCGERGTGKSSAMISFANSLINIKKAVGFYSEYSKISQYKYYPIEVIDPSMFEEKENIFEIVLAQLFSSFEKALDNNEKRTNIEDKRKVLELFQKVYENLKTIQKNGDKYNGEALETLSKLSCGANLRNNFSKLINEYLNFIKPEKDNKACLIIPIDDFDLNIRSVAHMAEQVRKYLMIPNVIILLAADIKQLSDAKEQNIREDFKTLINAKAMSESPKSITSKYILKLIPVQRRLELPYLQNNNQKIKLTKCDKIISQDNETIQDLFLRLCYQHYHILFIKPRIGIHTIIPNNIRELKEWLLFLAESPVKETEALQIFNNKFISYYCNNSLEKEEDLKLIEIINNTSSDELHLKIIKEVLILFNSENLIIDKEYKSIIGDTADKSENALIKDFIEISKHGNYPFNISLGDLLLFLDVVYRYHRNERISKIIFSLKTIISIRLKRGIINIGENSELNAIIGGSMINNTRTKLLSRKRTGFMFKYDKVSLNDIQLNEIMNVSYSNNEDYPKYIKIFECLHYFITIIGDAKLSYRADLDEKYYETYINRIGTKQQYAYFDLLAPISNLLNPKSVYNRVFNIYKTADNDDDLLKDSILNFIEENNSKIQFPFESVELIDYIFKSISSNFKTNIIATIKTIYQNIIDKFYEISKEHSYYKNNADLYIKKSPILEILFDDTYVVESDLTTASSNEQIVGSLLNAVEFYINDHFFPSKNEKTEIKNHNFTKTNLKARLKDIKILLDKEEISANDIIIDIKQFEDNISDIRVLIDNIEEAILSNAADECKNTNSNNSGEPINKDDEENLKYIEDNKKECNRTDVSASEIKDIINVWENEYLDEYLDE